MELQVCFNFLSPDGITPAKIWETEACHNDWLKETDVFQIEAAINEFRGAIELSIESIDPVPADEIDLTKLLPSSPITAEILEQRLQNLKNRFQDELLTKRLLSLRCKN